MRSSNKTQLPGAPFKSNNPWSNSTKCTLTVTTVGVVVAVALYWVLRPAGEAIPVQPQSTDKAGTWTVPVALGAATSAAPAVPASADIGIAIQNAVARLNAAPRIPVVGKGSWQGMNSADAALAFSFAANEAHTAAKAAEQVSPFGHGTSSARVEKMAP